MARYANIIVDISMEKLDKTFQYRIPEALKDSLTEGMQVIVPFGKGTRTLTGYVVELTDTCEFEPSRIKEILKIVEKGMPIEGQLIALAKWIKGTYGGTTNQALKTVLPVRKRVQEKTRRWLVRKISTEEAEDYLKVFKQKHQTARFRLLTALMDTSRLDYRLVLEQLHLTAATVKKLEEMGILMIETSMLFRNPVRTSEMESHPFDLTESQKTIVENIRIRTLKGDMRPALIHGVTGSGKTAVYLELIA